MIFVILRDTVHTFQAIANKKSFSDPESFKRILSTPKESLVKLTGVIRPSAIEIKSVSFHHIEMDVTDFEVISASDPPLIEVEMAEQPEESERGHVLQVTRLDNRWLDLRAPVNHAIFRLKSSFEEELRSYLRDDGFISVHTPKLIESAPESGAEVFPVDFFGRKAYLAQSPQLYKQMLINSDFEGVYEVAPVFRAENCVSHRHLCEFTGFDLEMRLGFNGRDTYRDFLEMVWVGLCRAFSQVADDKSYVELIQDRLGCVPSLTIPRTPVFIDFREGVSMLQEAGCDQDPLDDLNTANEKKLGELVKEKYDTDMFILERYPTGKRAFYSMVDESDPDYCLSYDIILCGTEIASGAQREHRYEKLLEAAKVKGVSPDSIKGYLESFRNGCHPHAGCGFGLERILMLILGLETVRRTSLFPRDPKRIYP